MPFSKTQLEALSRDREGDLAQAPFARLLAAMALFERTVVLELHRGQLNKKVVVEFGVPVDCRSNLVHETLGRYLAATGKLSEEEAESFFRDSLAQRIPLGELLVQRGKLSHPDLYRVLQMNLAKKLLDLFTWREGSFRLLFDVPEVESALKVNAPQLLFTGLSRLTAQEEVDAGIGPLVGKPLVLHPAPLFPLEELTFSERQGKLIEALRTPRRLDELAREAGIKISELARLLFALVEMGTVAPADAVPARPAPAPTPPVAPPVAPAPPPAPTTVPAAGPSPAEVDRIREAVLKAYLSYRKQDAFDLLGLPETARPGDIQKRFLELSGQFHPVRFEAPPLRDLSEKASDLFLALAKAYTHLGDEESRNALLRRRKEAREVAARPPLSPAKDPYAQLLDPAVQFKTAQGFQRQGKHKEAIRYFEFAWDCDPQNAAYLAELAYARFLYESLLAGSALKQLAEALRLEPKCGVAALYTGIILKETEKPKEAEPFLKTAALLLPKDPRPQEALQALDKKKGFWK